MSAEIRKTRILFSQIRSGVLHSTFYVIQKAAGIWRGIFVASAIFPFLCSFRFWKQLVQGLLNKLYNPIWFELCMLDFSFKNAVGFFLSTYSSKSSWGDPAVMFHGKPCLDVFISSWLFTQMPFNSCIYRKRDSSSGSASLGARRGPLWLQNFIIMLWAVTSHNCNWAGFILKQMYHNRDSALEHLCAKYRFSETFLNLGFWSQILVSTWKTNFPALGLF